MARGGETEMESVLELERLEVIGLRRGRSWRRLGCADGRALGDIHASREPHHELPNPPGPGMSVAGVAVRGERRNGWSARLYVSRLPLQPQFWEART